MVTVHIYPLTASHTHHRYSLPAAKTMPMPEPRYPDYDDDTAYMETLGGAHATGEGADGVASTSARAAWMPMICQTAATDIIRSASTNVRGQQKCAESFRIIPDQHGYIKVFLKLVDFR